MHTNADCVCVPTDTTARVASVKYILARVILIEFLIKILCLV